MKPILTTLPNITHRPGLRQGHMALCRMPRGSRPPAACHPDLRTGRELVTEELLMPLGRGLPPPPGNPSVNRPIAWQGRRCLTTAEGCCHFTMHHRSSYCVSCFVFSLDISTCLDICPGVCGRSMLWGN